MAPLDALNATDRLLSRLSTQGLEQLAFGGKIMVLGGDFRQVPPVVNHGSETQIVENSIKSGKIWKSFKRLKLTINMRAGQDNYFDQAEAFLGQSQTILETQWRGNQ